MTRPVSVRLAARAGEWFRVVESGSADGFLSSSTGRVELALVACDLAPARREVADLLGAGKLEEAYEVPCPRCSVPYARRGTDVFPTVADAPTGLLLDCDACGLEYPSLEKYATPVWRTTAAYYAVDLFAPRLRPSGVADTAGASRARPV